MKETKQEQTCRALFTYGQSLGAEVAREFRWRPAELLIELAAAGERHEFFKIIARIAICYLKPLPPALRRALLGSGVADEEWEERAAAFLTGFLKVDEKSDA